MGILSVQSHVAYGYVGNKAAVFPLQSLGFDVWPVSTVQFSNHTGYGKWTGEVFAADHVRQVVRGIEELGLVPKCEAVLSGYLGSEESGAVIQEVVQRFKAQNPAVLYLCDPVIGNETCFVKPEVLDFFKTKLAADIITPNMFEAEVLSGIKIDKVAKLKEAARFFHDKGIGLVVITGAKIAEFAGKLCVFVSDGKDAHLVQTKEFSFATPVNGTGDLFSALFLGCYLRHRDAVLALRQVVFFMEKVLLNTQKSGERELQVLSMRYDLALVDLLPEVQSV